MKEFNKFVKSLAESFQAFTSLVEKMSQKLETMSEPKAEPAPSPAKKSRAVSPKKAPARKISAKKVVAKPAVAARKPGRKPAQKPVQKPVRARRVKPEGGSTILESVQNVIESNPGIDVKSLLEKTGFETRQLQNTIFRLKKLGKITVEGRGVYYPAGIIQPEERVAETETAEA